MKIVYSVFGKEEKPKKYLRSTDQRFIQALAVEIILYNNERLRKLKIKQANKTSIKNDPL